ncbi:MAG: phosphatase PAP2 family protein [Bacteroidetes bacterium]|nr:phosphatase PAP2 family protein [Bacteroidota bacterium]
MKTFVKNNWLYFFLYILALSVAAYYLLQFDKVSIHLKINKLVGNTAIDTFFKYFTHIGDGVFAIILCLIILIFNIRNGIFVLGSYLLSGITTSILKNYLYDVNRPHFVFGYFLPDTKVNYIEGVDMMGLNSFPSGHSTSAFAIFTSLALITNNKNLKIIFFIFAFLSAFSRTYLSQHWLVDITIGSIIGTTATLLIYFAFYNTNKLQRLNKPLFNFKGA